MVTMKRGLLVDDDPCTGGGTMRWMGNEKTHHGYLSGAAAQRLKQVALSGSARARHVCAPAAHHHSCSCGPCCCWSAAQRRARHDPYRHGCLRRTHRRCSPAPGPSCAGPAWRGRPWKNVEDGGRALLGCKSPPAQWAAHSSRQCLRWLAALAALWNAQSGQRGQRRKQAPCLRVLAREPGRSLWALLATCTAAERGLWVGRLAHTEWPRRGWAPRTYTGEAVCVRMPHMDGRG